MSGIWQLVGFAAGIVAFILVLELLDLPEWVSTYLKKRRPRKELEEKVDELQNGLKSWKRKTNPKSVKGEHPALPFISRYMHEIQTYGYDSAPLELMAYALDNHYSTGGDYLDIPDFVQLKI